MTVATSGSNMRGVSAPQDISTTIPQGRPVGVADSPEASVSPEVQNAFNSRFSDWVSRFPFLSDMPVSPALIRQAQAALDPETSNVAGVSLATPQGRNQLFKQCSPGVLLASMLSFAHIDPATGTRHENLFVLPRLSDLLPALQSHDGHSQKLACAILLRGTYGVTDSVGSILREAISSASHLPPDVKEQVHHHFRL